jgi:ribokinase
MSVKTIVIGSLNTDLVAVGIKKFPKPGEQVYGKELRIGPGGKSRNIADMIAHLAPANSVAMIGRTVRDSYGLWKQPIEALAKINVNTDYVTILDNSETQKLPAIALIPVDENGNNQIFVLPGISDDFSNDDIDKAAPLFEEAKQNKGYLVTTLECPLETVKYAIRKANEHGLKAIFDPGGIEDDTDLTDLLKSGIYLIKPNEHEAYTLTGIQVTDSTSAETAAKKLQALGIPNIIITVGADGAYLFTDTVNKHIPIPEVNAGNEKDETGCGDQTIAALVAGLQGGKSIEEATEIAILAGTLQFHKIGVQPIKKDDLLNVKGSV